MKESKKPPRIPDGFHELLESLSYDVLKAQPDDLIKFCIDNLSNRLQNANSAHLGRSGSENRPVESESILDADMLSTVTGIRRQGVAAESWDPEAMSKYEKVVYPKSDEQKSKLRAASQNILLFRCLEEEEFSDVVDVMFEYKVQSGQNVITYGELGDNFYIIEKGKFDVFINQEGEMKKITQYEDQGSFGELALMYNTPRAATITAVTDGVLWAMSRDTFRAIVLTKAFKKRKLYEQLLQSVELLSALSPYERTNLADALTPRIIEANEAVFKQGEIGREMYFIVSGSVVVRMIEADGRELELCRLGENEYFGELALITQNPRAASVITTSRTKLAVLDVDSFVRILGPCQGMLQDKVEEYAVRLREISISGSKSK